MCGRGPRSRWGHASRPRHALSLLEVCLVLAIISVGAAIAAPRYAAYTVRYRADLAARRVAKDLDLARSSARAGSSTRAVVFDTTKSRYQVQGWTSLDNKNAAYWVALSDSPYGVQLVSAAFGGIATVTYNGWGLPSAGGKVTLAVGPEQRTVTVDSRTGQASIP